MSLPTLCSFSESTAALLYACQDSAELHTEQQTLVSLCAAAALRSMLIQYCVVLHLQQNFQLHPKHMLTICVFLLQIQIVSLGRQQGLMYVKGWSFSGEHHYSPLLPASVL